MVRALVCLAVFVLGTLVAQAAEPVFPTGSRLGFVPPAGFEASARFSGFEDKGSGASILIVDMPPQAFAEMDKQMRKQNVRKQGLAEETRETLPLATGKGMLIVGNQERDGQTVRKWILLAALREATALIVAQVPGDAKSAPSDAAMRAALATLAVRPSVPIKEQLELLPITFDELSGLRPVRVLGTTAAFLTEGPKDTLEATEQPVMIVSIGSGSPEPAPARETFARNLFTGLADFKDLRIVGADMLRLGGGLQTHQLLAEAKDAKTGVPMKLVQWVRFGRSGFVRMVGIARADAWSEAFPRFRAVRDGVNPRG